MIPKLLLAALVFMGAVIAPAVAAQSTDATLTYDATGRPLLVGQIDAAGDLPLTFRFDSAASDTVLYESAAVGLVLKTTPFEARKVYTATGLKRRPTYIVGGFSSLGARLTVERTISLPDPKDRSAVGLLGVDIFAKKVVLLDPKAGRAALISKELAENLGYSEIRGKPVAGGSIGITLSIGGVDFPALVDTGAAHTIMNSAAIPIIERHLGEGLRRKDGEMRAIINADNLATADPYLVSSLQFGEETITDVTIYRADLPIFTMLGARRVPAFILGMDIIGKRPIAFDFERFRLFVGEKVILTK